MKITRIKPPKFRIGRYVLNEYEIRQYCLEVAEGKREEGAVVKDSEGNTATILRDGKLTRELKGWDIGGTIAIKHYKCQLRMREAQANWELLEDVPVNEDGELDENFTPKLRKGSITFFKGEDCEEVWHWFEAHYDLIVAADLMYSDFKW